MKLNTERKKQTGAFYTPKFWADLAVEYMRNALPLPLEEYFFYDPAGGEGALLEALPEGCQKLATTLEAEDVFIMRDKNIKAYRFDFLNDEIWKVKERLQPYINTDRLVTFTNPPFVRLPAQNKSWAHQVYNTNDSIYLFYYRLIYELNISYLCSFNKPLRSPSMWKHTENLFFDTGATFLGGFMSHSQEHWGLSGSFSVDFNMFSFLFEEVSPFGNTDIPVKKFPNGYIPYLPLDVWEHGQKTGVKNCFFYG